MYYSVDKLKDIHTNVYDELYNLLQNVSHFPCSFAKTSFNTKSMAIGVYKHFQCQDSLHELANDLHQYASLELCNYDNEIKQRFSTFVAVFEDDNSEDFTSFHDNFFAFLNHLIRIDNKWPKDICKDIESPDFSFYFSQKIWFPVSLSAFHPYIIRQSKSTIIAFQPGVIFDNNKKIYTKKFESMRASIHKKIDRLYKDTEKPKYLTSLSSGFNYIQYIGEDFNLISSTYKCPLSVHNK